MRLFNIILNWNKRTHKQKISREFAVCHKVKMNVKRKLMLWLCLVSLFNVISTFMGYLMPNSSLEKNSNECYSTHSWRVIPFPRVITSKVNGTAPRVSNSLISTLQSRSLTITLQIFPQTDTEIVSMILFRRRTLIEFSKNRKTHTGIFSDKYWSKNNF